MTRSTSQQPQRLPRRSLRHVPFARLATPRRRTQLAAFSLFALTAATALTACEHDPRPKQRPQNVPLFATWAGGRDGGAYFDCSAGGAANQCTVWDDGTGNIRLSGPFRLRDQKRAAFASELTYQSTDNTNIYLDNGLVLIPAK